ncbi:hypothetical protein BDF14DRAFT_921536 [Spinellus fusiger]|nr:hypothetical protein BDF14DRAFT_921536 [Spinellus fusiger]
MIVNNKIPSLHYYLYGNYGNYDFCHRNSSTRRNIKTLGREHLYPTWIEDLCWATPTTLALCPSIRRDSRGSSPQSEDRETVSLVHISAVTDTTVEGRVQNMETLPHTKGYSTIAPLSIDHLSLAGIERASFVTGGNDKSVVSGSFFFSFFFLKDTEPISVCVY